MDDWKVGDLALCVKNGQWYDADGGCEHYGIPVRSGMVLSVRRVGQAVGHPCRALWFEGVEDRVSPAGFGSIRFRKIRPLTDEERDSFLVDLDAPVSPAVPSTVAPAGDVAQQRTGHPLPHTAAAPAGAVVKLPASLNPHPTGEAGSFIFNHFEHGSHVGHE